MLITFKNKGSQAAFILNIIFNIVDRDPNKDTT